MKELNIDFKGLVQIDMRDTVIKHIPQDEGSFSVDITQVEYVSGFKLLLTFSDDKKQYVDFEPFLKNSGHPDIRSYLNLQKFKEFELINGNLNWHDYSLIFPVEDLYNGAL